MRIFALGIFGGVSTAIGAEEAHRSRRLRRGRWWREKHRRPIFFKWRML